MKEPRAHPLDIPYRHAGTRHDGNDSAHVQVDGMPYTVQHGYLVPHYPPDTRNKPLRLEELVSKRARRFFYSTDPELDVDLTTEEIERLLEDYRHCDDPQDKMIKGNYLAGHMVNRMERLGRAYLQHDINGINLELPTDDEHHTLTPEQIAACRKEFARYYTFLVGPEGTLMLKDVILHGGGRDYDGVLLDIVRELGKPIVYPEEQLNGDIQRKIGLTMDAIAEAHDSLAPLFTTKTMRTALDQAVERCDIPDAIKPGWKQYQAMLQEMSELCRARTGIKVEDIDNFVPLRERIRKLNFQFEAIHQEVKDFSAHQKGAVGVTQGKRILSDGINLMRNMASMRLPRNHHSLDVHDQERYDPVTEPEKDLSSTGRLKTRANSWAEEALKREAPATPLTQTTEREPVSRDKRRER